MVNEKKRREMGRQEEERAEEIRRGESWGNRKRRKLGKQEEEKDGKTGREKS